MQPVICFGCFFATGTWLSPLAIWFLFFLTNAVLGASKRANLYIDVGVLGELCFEAGSHWIWHVLGIPA